MPDVYVAALSLSLTVLIERIDDSDEFETSTAMRRGHYELWLGRAAL